MGVPTNEKIEKILKAPQPDGKNFATIVTSLELLNKKEGYEIKPKNNPNYTNKHMRFKRVLEPPKTLESEDDPNYSLKKYSKQLLNKTINPDEYREVLRAHGINPFIEGINKMVRQHEAGMNVKFNELLNAVVKNRDSKFDPTQIKFNVQNKHHMTETEGEENGSSSMVPSGNGTSQLSYFPKKKRVNVNHCSFNSNKELFDWELSSLNKIKNGEFSPPTQHKNSSTHKTVFASHVFDDTPIQESPKKNKASTAFFSGTGDFFTWKGSINENQSAQKEVKRRNPNETSKVEVVEKKPVKVNKMLASSQENFLNNQRR